MFLCIFQGEMCRWMRTWLVEEQNINEHGEPTVETPRCLCNHRSKARQIMQTLPRSSHRLQRSSVCSSIFTNFCRSFSTMSQKQLKEKDFFFKARVQNLMHGYGWVYPSSCGIFNLSFECWDILGIKLVRIAKCFSAMCLNAVLNSGTFFQTRVKLL